MRRSRMVLMAAVSGAILLLALVASGAPAPASAVPQCGPGDHWVDGCPAGTDDMDPTTGYAAIDVNGDCAVDLVVILSGGVKVERQDGQAAAVPHSMDTEIVEMELTDGMFTLKAGRDTPGIDPAVQDTFGRIEEQAGDAALADSFFDVFLQIDGPPGTLFNHDAVKVEAVIDHVPPPALYWHIAPPSDRLCLPLFDDPIGGSPTGVNLVGAAHLVEPEAVGGITELDPLAGAAVEQSAGSAGGSGWPAGTYAALAGGIGAVVVALGAGGWYARRRFIRG